MTRKEAKQAIQSALNVIHGSPLVNMITPEHNYLIGGVKTGQLTAKEAASKIMAAYTSECTKLFNAR